MKIKSIIQTNQCEKNTSVLCLNVSSAYYTQELHINVSFKVYESPLFGQ